MNSAFIGIALAVFLILVVVVIVMVKRRSYQSDDPTRAKVVAAVDNLIQVLKKTGGVFATYQAQQKQCKALVQAYDALWPLDRKSTLFQEQMLRTRKAIYSSMRDPDNYSFKENYKTWC